MFFYCAVGHDFVYYTYCDSITERSEINEPKNRDYFDSPNRPHVWLFRFQAGLESG